MNKKPQVNPHTQEFPIVFNKNSVIKISEMSVKQWELGLRSARHYYISELAKFFDVSTDYLLGISDERKPTMIEKPIDLSVISTEELLKELHRRIS